MFSSALRVLAASSSSSSSSSSLFRCRFSTSTCKNFASVLESRGLLHACTADLEQTGGAFKVFDKTSRCIYVGFDPTADSLHVGNLVLLMGMWHAQQCGHRVIGVVGGATGMIGDPSGRDSERQLLSEDTIEKNIKGIGQCIEKILGKDGERMMLLNNADWTKNISVISFLRDVGKHFRVGTMMSRDSVKNRMADEGMSFTEFSYQLLQAYDFYHLYKHHQCTVQLGGSDQWGNIVGGCDLIRKKEGEANVFGCTLPLLTTSSGQKFGKSAGNAVWLDKNKTSTYSLFQFFMNTADADVEKLLAFLTILPMPDIQEIMHEHNKNKENRVAQRELATAVCTFVHGKSEFESALKASRALFSGEEGWVEAVSDLPKVHVAKSRFECNNALLMNIAVELGFCTSNSEFRRLVQAGGFYVNNK